MNMSWIVTAHGRTAMLSFAFFESAEEEEIQDEEEEYEPEDQIPDMESPSSDDDDITTDPEVDSETALHRMGFHPVSPVF